MSEPSRMLIKEKIAVPSGRVVLAWIMLVVLPVFVSLYALDYFLEEYSYFSESGRLAEAYNELELFKESLNVESFLNSRLQIVKKLSATDFSSEKLLKLRSDIDTAIG
ncbi:MAG: hypothetical protein PHD82_05625, partial [Candidatus Riflebacteria bacterium]|nr:hypothetical protein [Candidatus Riflebacteria bacterium]